MRRTSLWRNLFWTHVQIVVDSMGSWNGEGCHLCDLFQVVTGDSTREADDSIVDEDLDCTQRTVAGRMQGTFNSFGQMEVFQALRG